ncbi:MAG: helix-hairpin-helix domain-containing protein [Candidatus Omnitrophica bacterium]|nr:helix-hairpin-helix domain-containing protein [Candidatus Omnitrophota bacterium]
MVHRGIDALQASGVEVDFGMSPLDFAFGERRSWGAAAGPNAADEAAMAANVSQVMRRAEYILRSKIDLPRARCESAQEAMLRCLPGVGPETARAMVAAGIRPKLQGGIRLSREAEHAGEAFLLDDLMKVPGIGKKKAEKILKALDG